ncbi:MAG TPA: DsbA family protein [Candidatus Woesebacteria bacterium]|nr:DsbA family protein [Candidatus Woesebacteria bacterium]
MNKESSRSKEVNKKTDVGVGMEAVTIDIQPLLTPISILLSAVIISTSIFFSFRGVNLSNSATPSSNTTGTTDTAQAPSVAGTGEANPSATTTLDDDPVLGDKDKAKVAIVEFSDYECPFCKRHHQETFDQIVKNYVDTGKAIIVYRDFPLSFHDPLASTEAMAAECVQDIAGDKKYFEYSKSVFNTTNSNGQGLEVKKLYELADGIGLDGNKVKDCVDNGKFKAEIQDDIADGGKAGVNGTPGFVIGVLKDDGTVDGVNVSGAQPYSVFEQVINEQLDRTN